jgi:hypothetical protein
LTNRTIFVTAAAAVTLAAVTFGCAGPARANSCDRLWYERNSIYADAGYCFKTPRARAAFGRGCVPPYGQLSPREQRRVNAIQAEEADLGCSD